MHGPVGTTELVLYRETCVKPQMLIVVVGYQIAM